ncbi:MAG: hypothetical protein EXS03_09535 [Phycisphaerales bacterium]|nr:hypothetical protein [Phycisphaerales bacterium]
MKLSKAWIVVLLVVIALISLRAMTGQGMGRVYVKAAPQTVEISADAATGTEAKTIRWMEWHAVPPKDYTAAQAADPAQTSIQMSWARTIGLWMAAFFTLAIFSFMYRDNPGYRVAEAVIIGVSAAYWMVIGFWDTIVPKLLGGLTPAFVREHILPTQIDQSFTQNIAMWCALALGIMLLMRLSSKGAWISLWPLAFIIGVTAGLKIVSHVESDLLAQSVATFKPLAAVQRDASGAFDLMPTIWKSLANILVVVGVLCCLVYFFFSVEHKGLVGRGARVGIWYLMITFGAAFGFTVMGRVALLAARMEFLFDDWLWLIDPAGKRAVDVAAMIVGI